VADAAILIPHHNDSLRLGRCLAALSPQIAMQTEGRVELLVIDNGSTEDFGPVIAAYPGLRIVIEPQKGAANARNRGVVSTTAPLLFFLDCDCLPEPDWLDTAFKVVGRADLVGGEITVFDETPPPRTGAQAFEAVFAFDNKGYIETKGFSVTANLLTRRDVFDTVGPFVHGLSEDLDWCRRATAKGYRLVHAPELRAGHPSRGDWVALIRKWRRLTVEAFGVNGSTPSRRVVWVLKALAMPMSVLIHTPRVLRHPSLRTSERALALLTLARLRLTRAVWMLRQATGHII